MDARNPQPSRPVEAAVGLAVVAGSVGVSLTRGLLRAATPLGRILLHPPGISSRLHPGRVVDALADRGREVLASPNGDAERLLAVVVPAVVREILDAIDLNALIRERIDLVGLAASVDFVELLERIDVDTIVKRLDINAIVEQIDIDAIARRIDVDALVQRLDLDAVAEQIDLNAVADRIDLDRVVGRVDVVGLTEKVLGEIDLPEIVRESTGSIGTQVVRDARSQSYVADEFVSRVADRLLRRRPRPTTESRGRPLIQDDVIIDGERNP
jgi:hypothetical protein